MFGSFLCFGGLFGWFNMLYCSLSISRMPMRMRCWGVVGVTLGISVFVTAGGGCVPGWVGLDVGEV